jgi:hypothetical protein
MKKIKEAICDVFHQLKTFPKTGKIYYECDIVKWPQFFNDLYIAKSLDM